MPNTSTGFIAVQLPVSLRHPCSAQAYVGVCGAPAAIGRQRLRKGAAAPAAGLGAGRRPCAALERASPGSQLAVHVRTAWCAAGAARGITCSSRRVLASTWMQSDRGETRTDTERILWQRVVRSVDLQPQSAPGGDIRAHITSACCVEVVLTSRSGLVVVVDQLQKWNVAEPLLPGKADSLRKDDLLHSCVAVL